MDRARQMTVFLLRVVAGLRLLQSGGMKLVDWFGGVPSERDERPTLRSIH